MKRSLLLLLCVAVVGCQEGTTPTSVQSGLRPSFSKVDNAIAGRYIVKLRPGVDGAALAAEHGVKADFIYRRVLNGFAGPMPVGIANRLAQDPRVELVEEDGVMTVVTTETGATWGIDRIDQRARPTDGLYHYNNTGAGVTAYIIDTAIRFDHSEFGGRAVTGYDAVTTGGTAADCNGHGTHVSGTVGGAVYGVAKGVQLVAVRVLDCNGSGSTSGVVAGIDWVATNHLAGQPAVANMSLGGGASTTLDDAVRRAIADGVSFAIAAGNGNFIGIAQDACKASPARVTEAMTIGASDSGDRKASWSNYGNCVDWFAPGVNITSSWYTSATATNTISGTSMATPHTAGVAALYLQSNPGSTAQQVRDALYAATTKAVVTSSKTVNNHLLFTAY